MKDEYIKRSAAIQCARDVANDFKNEGFVAKAGGADTVGDLLQDFPAADVRPVARGKWEGYVQGGWIYAKCSECNTVHDVKSNFCPNCGARMEES